MKKSILLLLCLFILSSVAAQEKNSNTKPKIGVVLSGGGAKGLAHIGVLKVLEEAGVEISYIGGTSMGAIVGGLYASGYSAKELDSIFTSLDADALIRDYTPRGSKNFFEKRNDELYAIALPFQKFKLSFPQAISKGLYNYTTVSRLTDHVRHIRDFECLPIPFVCIATDIETGEEVILDEGVLPSAILASGAFPSLYNPVEIDGRLLIDGGVANNYPIEEIKRMGADIIIGVDVQDGLKDRTQIKGATGILTQINNYQMIKKMKSKRKATDIYIKPDITGYTVISFNEGRQIIDKGEEAAREIIEKLKLYGNGKPVVRENVPANDSIMVEEVSISGLKNYTRSYAIGKLNFKPHTKVSYEKFNQGISNLNATQNFKAISYSFDEGEKGDTLNLNLTEEPVYSYLKFGLHYDGLYKSGVLVNFTRKNLLIRNDVASVDVILGDNFRYMLNYYVDNGFYTSYGLRATYNGFNRNIPSNIVNETDVNFVNIDYTDFSNQIYIQTIFAQKFMIGGGLELKHLKIESETLSSNTEQVFDDSSYLSTYGYLKFDSYDNRHFPTEGWYLNGEAKTFLHSSDHEGEDNFNRFTILNAEIGTAKKIFKNTTIELQTESGITVGEDTVNFFSFVLGGYGYHTINNFRHFYGYDFVSISGNSYIKGEATIDWEFMKKNHINATANFANVGENLLDEGNILSLPQYTGYAMGYGLETIIGPIEIKHSWSPDNNKHYTWISVGFWF
ncbi:patatin-like phospholipase family protein [uncultured Flavobacterium sp.]|uniref:patatin-like phospholipase family protein n=1 Tax=uncultured Flavobacterium sp. TaxID=165435 RepID=UPI0025E2EE92|nr:patatin-like phospholipase family protein [uncultured Flavobacterium sp.]